MASFGSSSSSAGSSSSSSANAGSSSSSSGLTISMTSPSSTSTPSLRSRVHSRTRSLSRAIRPLHMFSEEEDSMFWALALEDFLRPPARSTETSFLCWYDGNKSATLCIQQARGLLQSPRTMTMIFYASLTLTPTPLIFRIIFNVDFFRYRERTSSWQFLFPLFLSIFFVILYMNMNIPTNTFTLSNSKFRILVNSFILFQLNVVGTCFFSTSVTYNLSSFLSEKANERPMLLRVVLILLFCSVIVWHPSWTVGRMFFTFTFVPVYVSGIQSVRHYLCERREACVRFDHGHNGSCTFPYLVLLT